MSLENPKDSATGILPITQVTSFSTGMSSITPLRVINCRVIPPAHSVGASILIFWIGSKSTELALRSAPLIEFLTAGIVWAGPLWIASSCNFASTSLTRTPVRGSSAIGPFLHTSLNASIISSLVSWRFCMPFVSFTSTVVAFMAYIFRIRSLSIPSSPNLFPTSFASLVLTGPSPRSPSLKAIITFSGSCSTST